MKFELVFSCFILIAMYLFAGTRADNDDEELKNLAEYLKKFDHIDVNEVLDNERLYLGYFNCFMDTGPCTPEGKAVKKALPVIHDTACEKCTADQKKAVAKILNYVKTKRPDNWNEIVAKYKPKVDLVEKFIQENQ